MTWIPITKDGPEGVNIYAADFPWKNGQPDWYRYSWEKSQRNVEKRAGKKFSDRLLKERCHFKVAGTATGLCFRKAIGYVTLVVPEDNQITGTNTATKLVPLCLEHKGLPERNGPASA